MNGLYNTGATDLKNIFLAPLEAVITADMELAQKITNFIALYGFEGGHKLNDKTQEPSIGKLRMVSFSFINNKGKPDTFSIPVLSLIQLPLLCIKDADFDMRVKMITTDDKESGPVAPPSLTGSLVTTALTRTKRSSVKAFLSPNAGGEKLSESMKANMKVRLRMGQSDMPGGIVKLLSMMNEIIQPDKTNEHG